MCVGPGGGQGETDVPVHTRPHMLILMNVSKVFSAESLSHVFKRSHFLFCFLELLIICFEISVIFMYVVFYISNFLMNLPFYSFFFLL